MAASLPLDYHIDDQYQKSEVMFMKDEAVGRQVSVMVDGKIPLQSVEGFTLLKRNVIDNSVRAIKRISSKQSGLTYNAKPTINLLDSAFTGH
ncbi:hypothetical protein CRV24_008667 [Beauveria bassiana]|nr:hypothetical protein CRV24_008667 [Beauveria bassiana]